MTELGQVMDHAAELQRSIDRLELELMYLAIAGLALTMLVGYLIWQARRR